MEIVNGFQLLSDFTKSSISDVWLSSKCASESHVEETVILNEWVSKYCANAETGLFGKTKKMTYHWLHQASWKPPIIYFYQFYLFRNYLCINPNYISRCKVKISHWKARHKTDSNHSGSLVKYLSIYNVLWCI